MSACWHKSHALLRLCWHPYIVVDVCISVIILCWSSGWIRLLSSSCLLLHCWLAFVGILSFACFWSWSPSPRHPQTCRSHDLFILSTEGQGYKQPSRKFTSQFVCLMVMQWTWYTPKRSNVLVKQPLFTWCYYFTPGPRWASSFTLSASNYVKVLQEAMK